MLAILHKGTFRATKRYIFYHLRALIPSDKPLVNFYGSLREETKISVVLWKNSYMEHGLEVQMTGFDYSFSLRTNSITYTFESVAE